MMRKCWHLTEDEFIDFLNGSKEELSKYDDFILDILRVTPTIPDTNIYYKIRESFEDFTFTKLLHLKNNLITHAVYNILKT